MLPQRSEMGQGQPADPSRLVPAADPDERPGGLQGKDRQSNYEWRVSIFSNNYLEEHFGLATCQTFLVTLSHRGTRGTQRLFTQCIIRGLYLIWGISDTK